MRASRRKVEQSGPVNFSTATRSKSPTEKEAVDERYSLPEPLASRQANRRRQWDIILSIDRAAASADTRHTCESLNAMGTMVSQVSWGQ